MKTHTRTLALMGLLIAVQLVLTRFLVYQTPSLRIGFGFLPQAIGSMLFGPVLGAVQGVAEDLLGMLVAPRGVYFPGFTLSALLTGAIYGLYLYKRPKTFLRIALAVLTVSVVVDLGLNTVWLSILLKQAALVLLPGRLLKTAIMVPVQVGLIFGVWKGAVERFERMTSR